MQICEIGNSLLWCSLSILLGKKGVCLVNTKLEQTVVLQDELNIRDWKVDEHTSYLRSFGADQLSHKFVDDCTDLILVVRVLRNDSWEDLLSSQDVLLVST